MLKYMELGCLWPVFWGLRGKKQKKQKIFRLAPLQSAVESSIIGLTSEREGWKAGTDGRTEAREAAGKIEGIGDVLSDGSKKHSWKVNQYERD